MPWEVTIRRRDHQPMGEVDALQTSIQNAIPDIQYHIEPSGLERIEAARRMGVEFPEVLRKHFENLPAKLNALYIAENLTVTIYGFESQPLLRLHAEIRGNGNPSTILNQLCVLNSWIAVDDSSGSEIELSDTPPRQWLDFLGYMDSVRE